MPSIVRPFSFFPPPARGGSGGVGSASCDDALAFRRSAAALAPASERQDSVQAALHAKHDAKALPPLRIALKRSTSRAGRYAGGVDARTARERG